MKEIKNMTSEELEEEMDTLDRKIKWHMGRINGSYSLAECYRKRYNKLFRERRKR